jgi:alpha,alpha-trehalose phosphorylase
VFTNLMAARNLRTAADVAVRHRNRAAELGVDDPEIQAWRAAAEHMMVHFDAELGVTSQSEGFTRYRRWDFEATRGDEYPLLLHYPYYLLYSSQVVKQADLVFALYVCGDQFDVAQKQRDFAYYEPITVRDSSLSASIQAIVAAEVGHLGLAYDYFRETASIDLRDLADNTADGLHLASLSGAWLVAVAGFGGMRDHANILAFTPRLPAPLTRLCFRLVYRGRRLRVEVTAEYALYELLAGEPLELSHYGEPFTLSADSPITRTYPKALEPPPVEPPAGRSACRHGVGAHDTSAHMTAQPPRR